MNSEKLNKKSWNNNETHKTPQKAAHSHITSQNQQYKKYINIKQCQKI